MGRGARWRFHMRHDLRRSVCVREFHFRMGTLRLISFPRTPMDNYVLCFLSSVDRLVLKPVVYFCEILGRTVTLGLLGLWLRDGHLPKSGRGMRFREQKKTLTVTLSLLGL